MLYFRKQVSKYLNKINYLYRSLQKKLYLTLLSSSYIILSNRIIEIQGFSLIEIMGSKGGEKY
jgi:hypothetical protein